MRVPIGSPSHQGGSEVMKGSVRRQGEESWEVRLYLGRGPNGRKLYKSHTVKGTKRRAQSELNDLLSKLQRGEYVAPTRTTVAEYLERWLADYASIKVAAKTYERYAEIVRSHLVPALGHHPLARLQPLHIQAYYSEALQQGRRDGRGGLSAQTVVHHHRVLREALQKAVRWQLLARNPADAVEPLRPQRREMEVFERGEVERLLDAARETWLAVLVLLAVTTGLRRGELLGLRWQDVDLEAGKLAVRQSLEQTKAGLSFKPPKTQKGRRVVTLPPLTVEALRRHRADQARERLLLGPAYHDRGRVLARSDGRPLNPAEVTRLFKRLVHKASVP